MAVGRAPTFIDYIVSISPNWLRRFWGSRMMGVVGGLMADASMEAAAQAIQLPWLRSGFQPPDSLPLNGSERSMPRYPADSDATYRERLAEAWATWEVGGNEESIIIQLDAFGLENVEVIPAVNADARPERPAFSFEHPEDTANWSRFTVAIEKPNPYEPAATYGSGDFYGTGAVYGVDIPLEDIETIGRIICKWKAGHTVCPFVVVVLSDTGTYYGDPNATYGGGETYGAEVTKIETQDTDYYGESGLHYGKQFFTYGKVCAI